MIQGPHLVFIQKIKSQISKSYHTKNFQKFLKKNLKLMNLTKSRLSDCFKCLL
jgi:hypothetical protein